MFMGDRVPMKNIVPSSSQPMTGRDSDGSENQQLQYQGENHQSDSGPFRGLPETNNDDENDCEDCLETELRKVDEDFHKNVSRARKVFDSRMENLQRTQTQRESDSSKTAEQLERERVAFEKRLHQEEVEQNRRIEQMQRDWERRREDLIQKQHQMIATDSAVRSVKSNTSMPMVNNQETLSSMASYTWDGPVPSSNSER